ncbi:MAG: hypothetical protein LBU26_04205 [Synergistaceae bacterium]|nr:hypothetical protein [Synergistaceae bacterium]
MAAETTLVADSMRYDTNSAVITATGNVHIASPDGEVFGDAGSGEAGGGHFEMRGNVRGHYKDTDGGVVNFSCASAAVDGRDEASRVVTASGDVKLSKNNDKLSADVIVWHSGAEMYSASGRVLGEFETYSIDADAVSRDVDTFSAQTVRKFYERGRKMTMTASRADGIIKNNEVTEMTAEGGVVITMPDKDGVMTRATGRKGIYSIDKGTVVLSGNATVTQPGRVLHSENIVYFLGTGHIDAQGSPSLTLETNRDK